jgi:hypothetical protein
MCTGSLQRSDRLTAYVEFNSFLFTIVLNGFQQIFYLGWIMKIGLERIVVLLILGVFIVASGSSLMSSRPVTEHEALEISKKSEFVREMLTRQLRFATFGAEYYNSSLLERIRALHPGDRDTAWQFKVPEGHSAWNVGWRFLEEGGWYYGVAVYIDAETGQMVGEFFRRIWG